MATLSEQEKLEIFMEVEELIKKGLVKPGYEGLTEEQAIKCIMVKVNFDEVEARFILAIERGELIEDDGNRLIFY